MRLRGVRQGELAGDVEGDDLRDPEEIESMRQQRDPLRIHSARLNSTLIGKIDEEGFIYILDRKKDMINRGGEKIYSLEVENVICDNPKVLEVAVVGVPDPVMGEVVKACVALKPGESSTEEEMKQFCAKHLADYKVPKFVEFMGSLPRNPAGKVSKPELRYVPGK